MRRMSETVLQQSIWSELSIRMCMYVCINIQVRHACLQLVDWSGIFLIPCLYQPQQMRLKRESRLEQRNQVCPNLFKTDFQGQISVPILTQSLQIKLDISFFHMLFGESTVLLAMPCHQIAYVRKSIAIFCPGNERRFIIVFCRIRKCLRISV